MNFGILILMFNFKLGNFFSIRYFLIKNSKTVKANNHNKIIIHKAIAINSLKPHDINSFGAGGGQSVLLYTIMEYKTTILHKATIFMKKYFLYSNKFIRQY